MKKYFTKIRKGFKYLGIFLALVALLIMCKSKAQSSHHNWEVKLQGTNFDDRNFIGNVLFASVKEDEKRNGIKIDLGFQADGRNLISLSNGFLVINKKDKKTQLILKPGIAIDYHKEKLFLSTALFCDRKEERLELFAGMKILRTVVGERTLKCIVDCGAMTGNRFKAGFYFALEGERVSSASQITDYSYLHLLSIELKWQPIKTWNALVLTTSAGYQNKKQGSATTYFPYHKGPETNQGFAGFIGSIFLF